MTQPCESADIDRNTMAACLLHLVSELRGQKERASQQRGAPVAFAEIVHSCVAGQIDTSMSFHKFLIELAEILDSNPPDAVDIELDKEWRTALRAWMEQRF